MKTTAADFAKAWTIMYGSTNESPTELVRKLNDRDLKNTFRRQAMSCHPDRAAINSSSSDDLDEKFKNLNWAYQTLKEVIGQGGVFAAPVAPAYQAPKQQPAQQPRPTAYQAPTYSHYATQATAEDHYWCGAVPKQKLPFGQFLYYSGRISWNTLLLALDWQETQRPKFGQIAMEGQLLSPGALTRLLAYRYRGERIGDAAMRLGYLSPRMKDAVLNIQKHRQPAIGQYFLTNGLLSQDELNNWLLSQHQHNSQAF